MNFWKWGDKIWIFENEVTKYEFMKIYVFCFSLKANMLLLIEMTKQNDKIIVFVFVKKHSTILSFL